MARVVIVGNMLRFDEGRYQIILGGYAGHGIYKNVWRSPEGEIVGEEHFVQIWTPMGHRNIACENYIDAKNLCFELTALIDKHNREKATSSVTEMTLDPQFYKEGNTHNGV